MPSESLHGTSGPRRDRSLVVAYWVLGLAALAELIVAAVGLAPKVASHVRKTQEASESPALQQSAAARPETAKQGPAIPAAATPKNDFSAPLANAGAETADQQAASTPAAPAPDSTDRPFRQPPSDAASPDGAVIEILNADIKGNDGGSKALQLAIKSRSREPIEVPQVKVQVYFYDEQNGEIVPSKAQVTSRWLSAPVDWKNGKPELLEVRYLSDSIDPDVRFAGYVVAIYYKGDLQDCRAEPPKLKKLFEPKYFIGLDEP
jgi:hypothetical protein